MYNVIFLKADFTISDFSSFSLFFVLLLLFCFVFLTKINHKYLVCYFFFFLGKDSETLGKETQRKP